ncbi:hypothetical protein T12_8539 [Trichinella patagoniensis]|uniref:Uncharacterized protein n=1 Tax=Trichinella patagoniensis TaxID=990121 RepID=A0A0V1A5S0_9BILA|nr:hypothetical protein T12_15762 [Trichinella patagoniensis]KRY20207.1 hypothetical protein T12_8539 [Trichinella patagoniensis]
MFKKKKIAKITLCIELLKVEKIRWAKNWNCLYADDVERKKSTLNYRKRRIDSDERFTFEAVE